MVVPSKYVVPGVHFVVPVLLVLACRAIMILACWMIPVGVALGAQVVYPCVMFVGATCLGIGVGSFVLFVGYHLCQLGQRFNLFLYVHCEP